TVASAGLSGEYNRLYFTKVEEGNVAITLANAEFKLSRYDGGSWQELSTHASNSNGLIDFNLVRNPNFYTNTLYKLTETKAPNGYKLSNREVFFVRKADGQDDAATLAALGGQSSLDQAGVNDLVYLDFIGERVLYFGNEPETIDISGQKTWNDDNNRDRKRPTSITVILYK
ncbi:SpaA isopeptide-forming pilin-related protein, partial [Histophilus somni]|uniref:SpaA isopeptide-forming pilin-related protein n=1 Tax=Histophilus somni TaxID=731 RepID=UPI00201F6A38